MVARQEVMRQRPIFQHLDRAHGLTERQMKLTDLFSRVMRPHHPGEIETAAGLATRFGNHAGSKAADRSSMAELVRLLKEAADAQDDRWPARSDTRPNHHSIIQK